MVTSQVAHALVAAVLASALSPLVVASVVISTKSTTIGWVKLGIFCGYTALIVYAIVSVLA